MVTIGWKLLKWDLEGSKGLADLGGGERLWGACCEGAPRVCCNERMARVVGWAVRDTWTPPPPKKNRCGLRPVCGVVCRH